MRLVVVAALLVAAPATADRLAPYATQQAAVGCWEVGAGATLTLTPVGKHSVDGTARFRVRPRGGPARMRERAQWIAEAAAYAVSCRPRSQHGSVCLVRPEAGRLRVEVIGFRYGGAPGRVIESMLAERCRP